MLLHCCRAVPLRQRPPQAPAATATTPLPQEQLEQLAEKQQIIMTRLQLADDPLGNEYLRLQRVQM